MTCFAHSGTLGNKSDWQTPADHSHAVARRAAEAARCFGLDKAAYVAGLFHDLGKYDPDFQRRLEGANLRVDHSTAGAAMLGRLAKGNDAGMAELIAYGILGHHAGLPDRNTAEASSFDRRLERYVDKLDPA